MEMVQVCAKTNAGHHTASPETVHSSTSLACGGGIEPGKRWRQSGSPGVTPRIPCQGLPCELFQRPFEAGYAWRLF
jgi:hypothetical protein